MYKKQLQDCFKDAGVGSFARDAPQRNVVCSNVVSGGTMVVIAGESMHLVDTNRSQRIHLRYTMARRPVSLSAIERVTLNASGKRVLLLTGISHEWNVV